MNEKSTSSLYSGIYTNTSRIDFASRLTIDHLQYLSRPIVVVDRCVLEKVEALFPSNLLIYPVEGGEKLKTLDNLERFLEFLTSHSITRQDSLISIGGGSVSDFVGFAASIYKRGIEWHCIPTTLIAQIDAAIGGKTALNLLNSGKNMIGTFHPPQRTIITHDWLENLPKSLYRAGIAEAIKITLLKSPSLFEELGHTRYLNAPTIRELIKLKLDVIGDDWQDTGNNRCLLNLGHTFGHVIEVLSEYTVSHGEAVGLGMLFITAFSIGEHSMLYNKISKLLQYHQLPTNWKSWIQEHTLERIITLLMNDKKNISEHITFIIPYSLGNCVKKTYSASYVKKFLEENMTPSRSPLRRGSGQLQFN